VSKSMDSLPPSSLPEKTEDQGIFASVFGFFRDLVPVVAISLAIIVPVRYFLVQPFYVKGASMEPNFHDEEYLIIDELSYRLREPVRGETVIFHYPIDETQYFIKRVVGLPGERVVVQEGKVTIYNLEHPAGVVLDETEYLGVLYTPGVRDVTMGPEEYFVLGDNRSVSLDSRSFGAIHKSLIVGRAWVRGWPPERAGVIENPILELAPDSQAK
jgi:signal peptidase I